MRLFRTEYGRHLVLGALVLGATACVALGAALLGADNAPSPLIDTPAKAKAAQEACAAQLGKPVQWTNGAGMNFQLVPAGEFMMGSPGDADAPLHRVRLTKPFYLATTEVTRAQWEALTGTVRSTYFPGAEMPINCVSWYEAQQFIGALSKKEGVKYRLPTEAEWEFAARGGATTRFPAGDAEQDLDRAGWFVKNSDNVLHAVGQKEPNAFGLQDMHGNAWEWCDDFYDPQSYAVSPLEDPKGPERSLYRYRVLRGGSIFYGAGMCASGHRDYFQESRYEKHIGFRVLLPIPAEPMPAPKPPKAK